MQAINKFAQSSCDVTVHINAVLRQSTNLQFVRFRKPRFVPKAKSKIFRVREPTPIDPKEYRLMMMWTRGYNRDLKSIRSYLYSYTMDLKAKQEKEALGMTWEQRLQRMIILNNKWNANTKKIRFAEEREKQFMSEIRQQKIIDRDERERTEMQEKAKERVLEVKNISSEFIAEEDLDREIEKLLNSRVSYEFALKKNGTIIEDDIEEDNEAQTEELNSVKQETINREEKPKPPTL